MDAPLALGSRHARPPKSIGGIRDINHCTPEQGEERVSSKPDNVKYFRKVAVIGLIVAVAINCFPLLIGLLERDTSGSQWGLNFLFTLQIGALIGLPSLALAIIASIIGVFFVKASPGGKIMNALYKGLAVAGIIAVI